jgi:hypothetical protein
MLESAKEIVAELNNLLIATDETLKGKELLDTNRIFIYLFYCRKLLSY